MISTLQIRVTGKVQGVFYRQSAKEKALSLEVTGHVRNCPDGSVEIIVSGTKEQLDELLKWCRQGPPRARVSHVEATEISAGLFDGFSIIR